MTTEEYYYSLTFADFVRNPHSNMTLVSIKDFNHTQLLMELADSDKKFSMGYEFNYMGYLNAPAFKYMAHSIIFKWKIGTKNPK
jgi:hypothetical protein